MQLFDQGNFTVSAGQRASAVVVSIPGDINGDGTVDIYDAVLLSSAYGSTPGSPTWNPNADANGDGIVDIYDAIIQSGHFGQTVLPITPTFS